MKMGREGHYRISFDTEVIFLASFTGLAAQRGQSREITARMVRATGAETRPFGPLQGVDPQQGAASPAVAPPPTAGDAVPFSTPNGWRAWWGTPDRSGRGYEMPDPPTDDPPELPTSANPFLWMVEGAAKPDSTWTLPRLIGLRAMADAKDVSGRETIVDEGDVAITTTNLYIPAQTMGIIMTEGSSRFAKDWDCRIRGIECDVTAVMETHDRRFIKLVAEQR